MAWALKQQRITDPTARHVLLCLANYAGADGCAAFPSVDTISKDTGLSERTIRAKLDLLLASGLIRMGNQGVAAAFVKRADRRPTVYDLDLERGATDAPRKVTGCNSRTNGVQITSERGAAPAPDPKALPINDPRAIVKNLRGTEREGEHLAGIAELLRCNPA